MFFKVFAFSSLKVEPSVGDCTDMWKKGLNEWVKFILLEKKVEKKARSQKPFQSHNLDNSNTF